MIQQAMLSKIYTRRLIPLTIIGFCYQCSKNIAPEEIKQRIFQLPIITCYAETAKELAFPLYVYRRKS